MSDLPPKKPVSMRKGTGAPSGSAESPEKSESADKAAAGSAVRTDPPKVPIPRTVDLAVIAIGLEVVFTMLRALALRGYTSQLSQWLIDSNNKATGKNHKAHYTASDVAHDLAQLRSGVLLQSVIVSIALVILGLSLRRVRGASGARWAILIVIVLTSGPLAVVPVHGWPMLPKVAGVLMGAASIAVIVLIVLPRSMNYFRDCKIASRGEGAAARPGLGGLFGPRSATAQRGAASGAAAAKRAQRSAAQSQPHTAEAANPARARSKAKVRADAEAVAKGAELARARQKAGKSRRD
ncbi:MAG TPA: hypothetical protein VFT67_08025 [Jatrophihabitantaceae bacterium]|nr:hypothetical protein [Jatrophihabitantaceae bacterium]